MLRSTLAILSLPVGTQGYARLVFWARGLRAFGDGYVSLLLPFYLTRLGFDALEVGFIVTGTLLGSGAMTLAVGFVAHRYRGRSMLLAASILMAATGLAVAAVTDFWPLLLIAIVGTLNPSTGDVSVFSPLEYAMLSRIVTPQSRTALFARYSLIGALVGALGAQAAVIPGFAERFLHINIQTGLETMFLAYGALGILSFVIYRNLPRQLELQQDEHPAPLGKSRSIVYKLAVLFSLDSFAGGFAVQSLLALWLFARFDLSVTSTGSIFFWIGILSALSQLASPRIAARFGLINTMVFTHIPANIFLILVPFMPSLPLALAFLFLRSALSQMDVPARSSYVMAVVTPGERAAAASVTAVPRSLAAATSPSLAGYMLALSGFGWPLVVCGVLKIAYDLLLLKMFSKVRPPEET